MSVEPWDRYHGALALCALGGGLALVAASTVWSQLRSRLLGLGLVVACAVVVAGGTPLPPVDALAAGLVALAVIVSGSECQPELLPSAGRLQSASAVDVLGLISLAGVWAAVPDTEPSLAFGAVMVVVALARARWQLVPGRLDRWCWIALILIAARWGSAGWPQWVGGMACVGLLVGPGSITASSIPVQFGVAVLSARWVTRFGVAAALPLAVAVILAGVIVDAALARVGRARVAP